MSTTTHTHKPKITVDYAILRDKPFIAEVEKQSFAFPWDEEELNRNVSQRNAIPFVAHVNGAKAGYVLIKLHRNYVEILRMVVAPEYRRQGVGAAIIKKISAKLDKERRGFLNLVVRETNMGGILFLRKMGFEATRVHRDFFEDEGVDGYEMEFQVSRVGSLRSVAAGVDDEVRRR